MWTNPQETGDLVKFTEEILNGKLHFLCSVILFDGQRDTATKTCELMWLISFTSEVQITYAHLDTLTHW